MAAIKFLDAAGKYTDDNAIEDVTRYICYPNKTIHSVIGGECVDMDNMANSMREVSQRFKKDSRKRLVHFVVSFVPYELYSLGMAQMIGDEIVKYIGLKYQAVYALHEDTYYPHIHVVFNRISYVDGSRYRGQHEEYHNIVEYVRLLLLYYGVPKFYVYKYRPPVLQEGIRDLEAENE